MRVYLGVGRGGDELCIRKYGITAYISIPMI
jgi:hypothetical protein